MDYPDRRERYSNIAPWKVGTIKDSLPAIRDARKDFRITTSQNPSAVEELPSVIPAPQESKIPSEKDIEL